MRDSLKRSLADSPVRDFERYPKGSVVLCNACALPILFLDRAICVGDRGGIADAFKPLSAMQVVELGRRDDIDAGIRTTLLAMTPEQVRTHVGKLHEFKNGDPMMCPCCGGCFVQVLAVEPHEALDRSYTMELLTIPPLGEGRPAPVRGKRLGVGKDWVH